MAFGHMIGMRARFAQYSGPVKKGTFKTLQIAFCTVKTKIILISEMNFT